MYFTVSDQAGSSAESYVRLFQHLKEVGRAGVFILHRGDTVSVPHTYFKVSCSLVDWLIHLLTYYPFFQELYILPLAGSDPKPSFIDQSSNYDRDVQNTLIGVFLTEKTKDSRPRSTPAVAPQIKTPAAVVGSLFSLPLSSPSFLVDLSPPADPQVASAQQAQLDGIASLIAALSKGSVPAAPAAPVAVVPVAAQVPAPVFSSSFNLASFLANSATTAPGPGANPLLPLLNLAPAHGAKVDAPYDPLEATSLPNVQHASSYAPSALAALQGPGFEPLYQPPQNPQHQPSRDDYGRQNDYRQGGGGHHDNHSGGYQDHRGGGGYLDQRGGGGGYNDRGYGGDRDRSSYHNNDRGSYHNNDRGYDRGYDRDFGRGGYPRGGRGGYPPRGRGW